MSSIICIVLLLIAAIEDIRTKTIPFWIPAVGIISGIALYFFSENKSDIIAGCILGLIMLGISFVVNDFGIGDSVIILMTGLLRGMSICIESLMIAFFIASLYGVVVFFIRKRKEKILLPFVPFLLAGVLSIEIISITDMF